MPSPSSTIDERDARADGETLLDTWGRPHLARIFALELYQLLKEALPLLKENPGPVEAFRVRATAVLAKVEGRS